MQNVFFPSCNFTKASPEAAKKIRAYLAAQDIPAAGCCRVEKKYNSPETNALYFCQACREFLEGRPENQVTCENLFVYLDGDPNFPWPDYGGLTVTVQDCWRDRKHPEIFQAVRSALKKMRVQVTEMEENREHSVFCGNLHFEPQRAENQALLQEYAELPLFQLPEEIQKKLMREQVEKYPCPLVLCYCNRCVQGVAMGGGRSIHLLELCMNTLQS